MITSQIGSLSELYEFATKSIQEIDDSPLSSIDQKYIDQVQKAVELLLEIQHKVHQLSLFSINETMEDVATTDLKYMKLLGLIGLVYVKLYDQNRKQILKESKRYMQLFLDFLELYGFDVMNEKPDRESKIQDFKKKKELKQKLEELNLSEEEQLRKYYVMQLDLLILEVKQEYWNIDMEMEMIEYKEQKEQDERMKHKGYQEERVETRNVRSERPVTLLSQKGKVLQPFVITTERAQREELQKGVFKPGHSLPSMTIEEYLDREIARGNVLSGGTEKPQKKEIDDLDYAALDAETEKQREWDEFKDHNPAGWGNRYKRG